MTSGMSRPVSTNGIKQVATLAGVSTQTVSRVLHNSPKVRPATRARVEAAIQQLNWQPSAVARALVTGRSRALGVVCPDTNLVGPTATLFAFERGARRSGYSVNIASVPAMDGTLVLRAVAELRALRVEGIAILFPQMSTLPAFAELPDLPFVTSWAGKEDVGVPVVTVAQEAGAYAATAHLLSLGHETIHHLAGVADALGARERENGWRAALRDHGAMVHEPLRGDWTAASGYAAGVAFARDSSVSAVFVASDRMAIGLLRAMNEAGKRIPDEVSVVGFDDNPDCPYYSPPLTSVRYDFEELGEVLFQRLEQQLTSGDKMADRTVLPSKLIERDSAARPAR